MRESKIYDHYPTKEDIDAFINEDNRPGSINYKRVNAKGHICWYKTLLWIIVNTSIIFLVCFGISYIKDLFWLQILLYVLVSLIALLVNFKFIVLFLVNLYQIIAPKRIRNKCRFEPSCSEYMKLAIKKYGGYKGFIKGIKRISRCHYPNGGYDYP